MSSKAETVLNELVTVSPDTVKSVQILCQHAGKTIIENGEVRYVSVRDVRRALRENVRGVIVPVPEISGPIWNKRLAKMCNTDVENNEILYVLFDYETEISPVRSWYYTNLAKYIIRTYMLPLRRFCRNADKELIFDLGNIEMQYDLMKKMIIPDMMKKAGLKLLVHKKNGNVEKELGFTSGDCVVNGDYAERVAQKDAGILLIKATRGVMERFIQGEIKNRPNRLETPALIASVESTYYCDMLAKKGYGFDVTDEMHIPEESILRKYEDILICGSCLFTEKEKKKINRLQKHGVRINSSGLKHKMIKGENLWEK